MTGENGYPVTPEWVCEPNPCSLPHMFSLSEQQPKPNEPHIIRGDN